MPLDQVPPPWRETIVGGALAVALAIVGRLMFHARQVQAGRRRFFSPHLVWELPVAIATGLIGKGIASYYGLGDWQETATIVTVAYLGPGFVEAVIWRVVDRLLPARGAANDRPAS
ncbi:phage holin family protein [Azospirillum argentinense]